MPAVIGPTKIRVSVTLHQAYAWRFFPGPIPREPREMLYKMQVKLIEHARDYAWTHGLVEPDYIRRVTIWNPSLEADSTGASALIAVKPHDFA